MDYNAFWIILTGSLATVSCALLGTFLVLRKMSLLSDALSHAVLPGIVIVFLLSGSRAVIVMFLGAAVFGVLATLLIEVFRSRWRVQEDAAIGIVFTSFFALGVVLVSAYTGHVDLDQECVLYGEIAYTPWDVWLVDGVSMGPRPVWVLGVAFVLTVLFIVLFYKELVISSFDPAMAASVGIGAGVVHYALMAMVSVTTVAAFESVGAILVVAMFIVPGASAYLWSSNLKRILLLASVIALVSSGGGYVLASSWNSSIAGGMVVVAGGVFLLSLLFAPQQGVLARAFARLRLSLRVARDHVLLELIRRSEVETNQDIRPRDLSLSERDSPWISAIAMRQLRRRGLMRVSGEALSLTEAGSAAAATLLRSHRLWESYMSNLGLPPDHLHDPADSVEHFITAGLREELDQELEDTSVDPQGKSIPSESDV